MEKELENPEKRKRRKHPSRPTKPSQATRPRHLTGGPRLSVAVLPRARPPSLARCPVGPICRCKFPSPARSLSLSVSRARSTSHRAVAPCVPFSLSTLWACLVSSAFPALAMDRRVRTRARRRISRPRCPPTRPAPFLEPCKCPAHTPRLISLSFTPSRVLLMPPVAIGDPRPRSRPSSSSENAPSLPELRPEVRHPSPCPISPIAPCVWPISPLPVLGRGGPPCLRGGRPI
jgi:hypothetical protein